MSVNENQKREMIELIELTKEENREENRKEQKKQQRTRKIKKIVPFAIIIIILCDFVIAMCADSSFREIVIDSFQNIKEFVVSINPFNNDDLPTETEAQSNNYVINPTNTLNDKKLATDVIDSDVLPMSNIEAPATINIEVSGFDDNLITKDLNLVFLPNATSNTDKCYTEYLLYDGNASTPFYKSDLIAGGKSIPVNLYDLLDVGTHQITYHANYYALDGETSFNSSNVIVTILVK